MIIEFENEYTITADKDLILQNISIDGELYYSICDSCDFKILPSFGYITINNGQSISLKYEGDVKGIVSINEVNLHEYTGTTIPNDSAIYIDSHHHNIRDIDGLTNILRNKADLLDGKLKYQQLPNHSHNIDDISGLDYALSNKADLVGGKVPKSQLPILDVIDVNELSEDFIAEVGINIIKNTAKIYGFKELL